MSVGVYSALFTSRMQTLLLLPCYAVLFGAFDLKQRLQNDHRMTSKYRESYKKAVGSYAFKSLSRYFDVIRWSFCTAPLQVERASCHAITWLSGSKRQADTFGYSERWNGRTPSYKRNEKGRKEILHIVHIVYNCIPNLSFLCSITVRCIPSLAFEYYFFIKPL